MFRWLLDRIRARRSRRQRDLFVYFDGKRTRQIDPMRVHIELDCHPEFRWDLGNAVDQGETEATQTVLKATREVFGLEAFDELTGRGLTAQETLAVLYQYTEFIEIVKKKYSPGPTSPPLGEPESSTAPADPEQAPI